MSCESSAGDGANDEQRFPARGNRFGEWGLGGLQREIFFAGKEAQKRTALEGVVVADGSAEHGVAGFERVEDRADSDGRGDFECDVAVDVRQVAKVVRQSYSN